MTLLNEFPTPPVNTHPVLASDLVTGDWLWVAYRSGVTLDGRVESVEPIAKGDYRIKIRINDENLTVELHLFANDYPGLHRFYKRGKFTDAETPTPVCVLLGEVNVDNNGDAYVNTGAETIKLGPATEALLETLTFLTTPRLVDEGEQFTLKRETVLTILNGINPKRSIATWVPSTAQSRGNTMNTEEATTLSHFKHIKAQLDPEAEVTTELSGSPGPWLTHHDHFEFLTDWLHTYLTDPNFTNMSLHQFATEAGRYTDTPVEDVTRHILFGLNHAVGRGVTLTAIPKSPLLHNIKSIFKTKK